MRRLLLIISLLMVALTAGGTTAAAQVTLPELPTDLPNVPSENLPEINISDDGVSVTVGDVSVTAGSEDGVTTVNAGDISVTTGGTGGTTVSVPGVPEITAPPATGEDDELGDVDDLADLGELDDLLSLSENGTITVGSVTVTSTTVDDQTTITVDIAEDDSTLSCEIQLAEGVTLTEFLESLEDENAAEDNESLDLPVDDLEALDLETELGTVSCEES